MDEFEWTSFNMKLRKEMADALDKEAKRLGIPRASLIRVILDRHIVETHRSF